MIINLLINTKTPGQIGSLEIDAVMSENHEINMQVTEFPIEAGFTISDHVVRKPPELRLECSISNSKFLQSLTATDNDKQEALIEQYAPELIGKSDTVPAAQANVDWVGEAIATLYNLAGYAPPNFALAPVPEGPTILTIVTGLCVYTGMVFSRLSIPRASADGDSITFSAEFKQVNIVNTSTAAVSNASELNGIAPRAAAQGAPKVKLVSNPPLSARIDSQTNTAIQNTLNNKSLSEYQRTSLVDEFIKYGSVKLPTPGGLVVPGVTP